MFFHLPAPCYLSRDQSASLSIECITLQSCPIIRSCFRGHFVVTSLRFRVILFNTFAPLSRPKPGRSGRIYIYTMSRNLYYPLSTIHYPKPALNHRFPRINASLSLNLAPRHVRYLPVPRFFRELPQGSTAFSLSITLFFFSSSSSSFFVLHVI